MTPEAARQKRCHHESRVAAAVHCHRLFASDFTLDDGCQAAQALTRCQADECMAWRWIVSPRRIDEAKRNVAGPPGTVAPTERAIAACEPSGYCGVAGSHGLD